MATRLFFLILIYLALVVCGASEFNSSKTTLGNFDLHVSQTGTVSWTVGVTHIADPDKVLWSSEASPTTTFVAIAGGSFTSSETSGNYVIKDKPSDRTMGQSIESTQYSPPFLYKIYGTLSDANQQPIASYTFSFIANNPNSSKADSLGFEVEIDDFGDSDRGVEYDRIYLTWESRDTEENFYGFGEQYTIHGLRGRTVPVFLSEQGVGRGLEPASFVIDLFCGNCAGDWHTTYTAIPHYISSTLRSVFINDTRYMSFDLAAERSPSHVDVMVLARVDGYSGVTSMSTQGVIIYGDSIQNIITQYTEYSGRISTPIPQWAMLNGAIAGWEGGTDAVKSVWKQLQDANVPIAGFWLQDWTGLRVDSFGKRLWWNWELDEEWYPNWSELVESLHSQGIRMTTYMNPFLANTVSSDKKHFLRDLWKEAAALGYLMTNSSGLPYIQTSASKTFSFSAIDLTNPAARKWTRRVIRCNMLGDQTGCDGNATAIRGYQSGFMSDFGEYTPFNSNNWANLTGLQLHNLYPQLWSQTCKEAIQEAGMEKEVTFWSRSASFGSMSETSLFWAGDQLTTYDEHDGLKSALRAILSGGLSGMSMSSTDIGGYTEFDYKIYAIIRTEELLMRWMEFEAFAGAIYRTHPGLLADEGAQFNSSNRTLSHFAYFANVHSTLGPYKQKLMAQAQESGLPMVRYMFMEFTYDSECWKLADQFMLGSDLLIAPVMNKGIDQLQVYLPAGQWTSIWNSSDVRNVTTGDYFTISAPLGRVPVYRRPSQTHRLATLLDSIQAKLADLYSSFQPEN